MGLHYGYGFVVWRPNTVVWTCFKTPEDVDPFGDGSDLPIKRCRFLTLPEWRNPSYTKATTDPRSHPELARIVIEL